jgi:hypothetical protein
LISATALAVPPPKNEGNRGNQVERNDGKPGNSKNERSYFFAVPFGVCASFPKAIDGLAKPANPTDENHYKPEDLKAQQATACFTEWIFYSTVLQFLLACVGAFLLLRTIRIGIAANRIAREIGRDETRAYVSASEANIYEWGGDGPRTMLTVSNHGTTPARWFIVHSTIGVAPMGNKVIYNDDLAFKSHGPFNGLPGAIGWKCEINSETQQSLRDMKKDSEFVVVQGYVEYETFYSERFVSQFLFFGARRKKPRYSKDESNVVTEIPKPLSRASAKLRVFERQV